MGFRFRKSVKIAPGVRLNLNRKSPSISLGGKGAHYTVSQLGAKQQRWGCRERAFRIQLQNQRESPLRGQKAAEPIHQEMVAVKRIKAAA